MSEIDLTKILKDCPSGTEFWSDNYGIVQFLFISEGIETPIVTIRDDGNKALYSQYGSLGINYPEFCLLWPSKDCRDWSKFTPTWPKNVKFDPQKLKPFDRVLVSDVDGDIWHCNIFEYIRECAYPYSCVYSAWERCIPYNDETKHLVGTTEEAPEYYRYWEE